MTTERIWLSSYPTEVSPNLEYPEYPVTEELIKSAERYPEHTALFFLGKSITYRELLHLCYRFANVLREQGVSRGERVALMLPNSPQYVLCYYGTLFAGAVAVQTNPLYAHHDLQHHLADCGAETIVCLDLVYPRVKAVREGLPLKRVIATGIKDFLPFPKNLLYPLVQKRKGPKVDVDWKKEPVDWLLPLLKKAAPAPITRVADMDEPAVLQYTGGTTGLSKGVMLTHRNLMANVTQCKEWVYRAVPGQEVMLTAVPMFHVYGMTVCMNYGLAMGAKLVLLPRFEIDQLLITIHKERPTLFPGAPTMYIAIINHPKLQQYDLTSINCCISGSASLPAEVQARFEELTQGKIVEGYGLSEASPVTHVNPIWERRKNGSIGLPWPDTECRIVDSEGAALPPGEIGEIIVRGPQVMKGYWNQPEETAAVLKDGWLYTGDMGYMDEQGYFYLVDRKKDVIVAGGFKVYPREVEEVLYEHPAVQEAVVVGIPDPYRGESVKAFLVLAAGRKADGKELDAYCRERLASYKVPREYEFRSELPKTMVGKILRRQLQDEEKRKASVQPIEPSEPKEG